MYNMYNIIEIMDEIDFIFYVRVLLYVHTHVGNENVLSTVCIQRELARR